MTSGELILQRLEQKLCIKCGQVSALDWPYICKHCQQDVNKEQQAKRERQDAADS